MIQNNKLLGEDQLQIVIFRVGDDYLSCPISQVREIIHLEKVTSVPSTPDMIRGIINRRGEIITILDLPQVIGQDIHLNENQSQLMILYSEDEKIGVMVSEVTEIPTIETENVEGPSDALETPINEDYLEGIIKKDDSLILLTDLLAIVENLSSEDLAIDENIDQDLTS